MSIHPYARTIVSQLSIPSPIQKYFSGDEWEIDLSNNTNPYLSEFAQYPDIKQEDLKKIYLKTLLSLMSFDYSKCKYSVPLTVENILFTVGSMEGIDILLRTFCEPNQDRIGIVYPTFSAYEHWGRLHNLEIKKIPLSGEKLNNFSAEDVIKVQPKMVFICNPNNPIGTLLKEGLIETLCKFIDGFVVVDEAYIEFSQKDSYLSLINKYNNLIILRTLSKAWGLAGVRCGAILADKWVVNTLRYTQLPFGLSDPTQTVVKQCLHAPERVFASWEKIKSHRDYLIHTLSSLEIVERVFESETNFITIILKNFKEVMKLLKEDKICVLDCSESLPDSIRVSVGTKEQNIAFIDVLHKASYG